MNIRSTKIVAALVAMALCTPNVATAQENQTTISGRTDVNGDFSLTRSISAVNRNDSESRDSKTIYVNPGDTIHVKLELQGNKDTKTHGFVKFKEEVSPIQEFSASSGSLTYKKITSTGPEVTKESLDKLTDGSFKKTSDQTIEFTPNQGTRFGTLGNPVTIDYSYTAGNTLGTYITHFQADQNFDSSTFDADKLKLTVVVKAKEENNPKPPEHGKKPTPPESNGGGFGWLTGALGVLAFLGGAVWFVIKHVLRL
ncbi:membrane protein [Corynebacterium diphtheriae]|nr:membrane protein [Corynebacterium diphtheriae]